MNSLNKLVHHPSVSRSNGGCGRFFLDSVGCAACFEENGSQTIINDNVLLCSGVLLTVPTFNEAGFILLGFRNFNDAPNFSF